MQWFLRPALEGCHGESVNGVLMLVVLLLCIRSLVFHLQPGACCKPCLGLVSELVSVKMAGVEVKKE